MTANITDTLSFEKKRALLAQLLEGGALPGGQAIGHGSPILNSAVLARSSISDATALT